MTREEAAQLHQFIDTLIEDIQPAIDGQPEEPEGKPAITAGKRVVRTKSTGDNVYEVDEVAKTKRWVRNPEVLKALGWEMSDVQDIEDKDLQGYAMEPSIYQVDET